MNVYNASGVDSNRKKLILSVALHKQNTRWKVLFQHTVALGKEWLWWQITRAYKNSPFHSTSNPFVNSEMPYKHRVFVYCPCSWYGFSLVLHNICLAIKQYFSRSNLGASCHVSEPNKKKSPIDSIINYLKYYLIKHFFILIKSYDENIYKLK